MNRPARVLITGGAGFIGSHIAEHFARPAAGEVAAERKAACAPSLQTDTEVRILDDLRSGYRRNLDGLACRFIEGSVTDRAAVREAVEGVDYVFHLAAMISVPESMQKPIECVEINTQGTLIVLEEAARAGVKKLCLSSSAAIYGDNPTLPKLETMLPEPKSPYAITKLDGEYYCRMFAEEGRLNTVCLRYFNVFGPRQDPRSPYAAAVPIFIEKALRHEPITIFGDGGQTRDFVYVRDVVAANVFLAQRPDLTGVYNVAYGGSITISDLAQTIVALTASRSTLQFAPPRAGDVRHSTADIGRIRSAGFAPLGDFSGGLKETIDHFRRQLQGSRS